MSENISRTLRQARFETPEKTAITLLYSRQPSQTLSYRDLWQRGRQYAHALQRNGIRPGEVVILVLQHGSDLITSFFGTILSGAIPSIMPFLTEKLVPEQYRSSLAALFKITAPAAVITYAEFASEARRAAAGSSVREILVAGQEHLARRADPGEDGDENTPGLESPMAGIALLQHSSGTTGLQKGVALSHQAVFNQLDSYSKALHLNQEDVIVSWLPLYHDMGLIAGFIMPILQRVPLTLMSPFDWVRAPYRLLEALSQYRGTLCWLPNFAYNFCAQKIQERDLADIDLSSVRAVINCSEPMYWNSHNQFLERFREYGFRAEALATCYAMAENVFAVTQGGINEPATVDVIDQKDLLTQQIARPICLEDQNKTETAREQPIVRMVSAGRPIEGTHVRVINQQGKDLPERQVGEIAIQSNCMLTEYYRRPDVTEKAFLDGWYLSGDLGYMADGELYVTGRKKDIIIVGGKNIYPQDLENLAGEVEGVHPGRVAAFGIFNEQSGTEDVVLIAEADAREGNGGFQSINVAMRLEEERERIAARVRQHVTRGSDVTLRTVYIVERNWLIKTSSGKVARQANKDKYIQKRMQDR
jgi:fatty-acyl-CoA synthase